MVEELQAFLRACASREFKYGEFDCGLWLADWLIIRGWPDAASKLRGTYNDADRFLFKICRSLDGIGLRRTFEPMLGDVGIVKLGTGYCGAICTGRRWALLSRNRSLSALNKDFVLKFVAWDSTL